MGKLRSLLSPMLLAAIACGSIGGIHGFSTRQQLRSSSPSTTTTTTTATSSHAKSAAAISEDGDRIVLDDRAILPPSSSSSSRRNFFLSTARAFVASSAAAVPPLLLASGVPEAAFASGGATAGKYTTIPIAKRRYYGRVQEAVHEFLLMAPAVIKGDLTDPTVQDFFDVTKTVVVEGKKKDINGVCTKKDGDCKSTTVFDSRYNDMKTSMYLLGNAFRINQTKAPENLPTVKAARKFFKQMNKFELVALKDPRGGGAKAREIYADALDCLDEFLDLVELPPTESGHYDKEFSTMVGESSRIT